MGFAVVETGLMSRLEKKFLSLVGVFTGVAELCPSLLGLFAGVKESPTSEAGVICNEPLDLLLSVELLPGEEDGREWTEFCLCSVFLVTEEGLWGGGVFSLSLEGGLFGDASVLLAL